MSSLPLPPPPPQHPDHPTIDPGASSPVGGKKRRAGAPKAKGAVRAKSGCYTCRIRRKKCDEQPDAEGNCQTCVRLRLECLGFGAKRPDWMRENNSVQELREKIKQFLASQGMIKGHSGGGVRPADQDPSVLNLSTEPGTLVPGATTSNMSSGAHEHHPRGRMAPISSVRDGPHDHMVHFPPLPGGHPFPPPPGQGHAPLPSQHHPPLVGAMPVHLDPELAYMPPSYGQPPPPPPPPQQQGQTSRPPMSSIPASPWPSAPSLRPPSSFGESYNIHDDYYNTQVQEVTGSSNSEIVPAMPPELSVVPFSLDTQAHVMHYMHHVLRIQYLLADPSIENFIFRFAQTSASARSAMCLLSAVHQQRMRQIVYSSGSGEGDTAEMDALFRQTAGLLRGADAYTEGDAMAGLHVVSCFLFTGGHGPWNHYLQVAIYWVRSVLLDRQYNGPLDAYRHCSESMQFVIRTTMWFDVWSAVTRRTQPRFQQIYCELFDGEHGYVSTGAGAGRVEMLSVMGCTNETVLAISETASLAYWKDVRTKQGNLSMPSLVERGRQIETLYLSREHDASLEGAKDDLDGRRRLAANVFRSSARVYLHSVLSGCKPQVKEISYGVSETVRMLRRVPSSEGASRSVVRSVVLSIALCGCMTDDAAHREYLGSCLVSLAGEEVEVLGNCKQAKLLMERVWERRDAGEGEVDWRDVIRDMTSADLLLA